jgi:glycosyltransferase involved in cell wall biosynthesis
MTEAVQIPKVSILMVTYNHEKFIAQAIESVLRQETKFPYELVIGEDCSTDQTREIVKAYANQYSDKVRALFHEHNLGYGGKLNLLKTLQACQGEYIAFLEGDDYWTKTDKLQKQVDFLDNHPDYAGAFHDTDVIYEDQDSMGTQFWQDWQNKLDCSLDDTIAYTTPFHTSSFLVRAKYLEELPEDFLQFNSADIVLYMKATSYGMLRRIPEKMSVYRRHEGGITQTSIQKGIEFLDNRIYLFSSLKKYLKNHNASQFNKIIAFHYFAACKLAFKNTPLSFNSYLTCLQSLGIIYKNSDIFTSLQILKYYLVYILAYFKIIQSEENI